LNNLGVRLVKAWKEEVVERGGGGGEEKEVDIDVFRQRRHGNVPRNIRSFPTTRD